MDRLLVAAKAPTLYEALRAQLHGDYELEWCPDPDRIQGRLDSGEVAVLLLDCPADCTPCCELLQQNELTHPFLECMAIMEPESFCAMALSKTYNLYSLMRPVETEEVVRALRGTGEKLTRVGILDPRQDPLFLRQQERQFWLNLIHSGGPAGEPFHEAPPPVNFSFQLDQPILPLLICFRGWRQAHTGREREVLRFGLSAALDQMFSQQYGGVTIPLDAESSLVLLYGGRLPDQEQLAALCRRFITAAERGLHCDATCYCGRLCRIHEVCAQVHTLIRGDRNNVVANQAVLTLDQLQRERPPLTPPMPRDWMVYFNQGRLDDFCRAIREFFDQAIASNTLDRDFLTRFQQDLVQELGFALKSAGVSANQLFRGTAGAEEMRDATRSVPAMEKWLRKTAEEAMVLTGATSENPDLIQTVIQYIQINMEKPVSRAELSQLLHVSQGHIARSFRERTGLRISEYIMRQRVDMAKQLLVQSELTPGEIAVRCGFADYPYFYKTFKRFTGRSPTAYRAEMQN